MATNNALNNGLSGTTGTGNFVGSTSPALITPTLGAASATSVTFSSTSGVVGTTTNNNAAAGSVGELMSSVIAFADRTSLSNSLAANLAVVNLTAGDWDLWGNTTFFNATTTLTSQSWISSASATIPDASLYAIVSTPSVLLNGTTMSLTPPAIRVSLASPTAVYLSVYSVFTVGTTTVCGGLYARRVR